MAQEFLSRERKPDGQRDREPRTPQRSLRGRAAALLLTASLAVACDQTSSRDGWQGIVQHPNPAPALPARVGELRPGFAPNSRHMEVAQRDTPVYKQLEPIVIGFPGQLGAGRQVEVNCALVAEDPDPNNGERLWYRIANSGPFDNVLAPADHFETRLPNGQLAEPTPNPNIPPCPDDY